MKNPRDITEDLMEFTRGILQLEIVDKNESIFFMVCYTKLDER